MSKRDSLGRFWSRQSVEPQSVADRFWSKVGPPTEVGCRLWTGAKNRHGYGHFRVNGKIEHAHRFSISLALGRAPEGNVLHSCDTPACCEPSHLSEGSHELNMQDCAAKRRNRAARPGNGHDKLGAATRSLIRRRFAQGETNKCALAREFGVTPTRIRQVVNHG